MAFTQPTIDLNAYYLQMGYQFAPPTKPVTEEELYSRKKCERCVNYYTEAENGPCFYHPGKFWEPSIMKGTLVGWSCCRVKQWDGTESFPIAIMNEAAMNRNAKGCKEAEQHLEDVAYSEILVHFPFDRNALENQSQQPIEIQQQQQEPIQEETVDEASVQTIEGHRYYKHKVLTNETLVGISLKYSISMEELKRANKLFSREIYTRKFLLIPVSPNTPLPQNEPDSRLELLRTFKSKTKSSLEEAKFYLDSNDGNVEKALQEWEEDKRWEEVNGTKNFRSVLNSKRPEISGSVENDILKSKGLCCGFSL